MNKWIDVDGVGAFQPGSRQVVDIDGTMVIVFMHEDGQFYAIEDICTHDGGELATGRIEGDAIICPRHGARFCIKTGEVLAPPAYEGIRTFPVRIQDSIVQIKDDR
ncbi:MAG: non-heme iron oxygenase ferredoxin subunit [Gammaproteobacteria bacterium]